MDNLPMTALRWFVMVVFALTPACLAVAAGGDGYAKWSKGPPSDPGFFPLAVWLQAASNAQRYRDAGFNTYVALWKGPTEEQLATLKKAGMCVICRQNEFALRHLDDPAIIGWMHGDEPDNAQSLGNGKGYGPPIAPEKIVADYQRVKTADPSRPVLLNLGQGVAYDNYIGRGVRRNHPEDYPEYLKGCDIASFDIYPVNHDSREVSSKLWFVAGGVERVVKWSGGEKIIWNCLECTRIGELDRKPTPHQARCEAWMSLICGSRGLIFFVHQFKPTFREAALLDDPEMLAAVTALNRQITELAPVLNSPTLRDAATVKSENTEVPIALMVKRQVGSMYLFAVGMRDGATTATFKLAGFDREKVADVLGESRTIAVKKGSFSDRFNPWDVHLYRVAAETTDGHR
ncbi:MAG: hypothetical protein DME19_04370 [Verrucomicrobia bacterium]|nr:MAG: hypothetical protein DME19_04370 [Verrucomicrobiota bacterium]